MTYLFPLLLLAMGIYVLYGAIVGKGRLFAMENIKEEAKEKVHKMLRGLYFALAVVLFLTAAVNFTQSVLYSSPLNYYEVTQAYYTDFADIIKEDGTVQYQGEDYTVAGQHNVTEMNALLMAANAVHPEKLTDQSSSSAMSCLGSSASQSKVAQYYNEIQVKDAEGNQVYQSTLGAVRSDANDGSFLSKLYGAFSNNLLRILSYVFMGIAIVGVIGLFVIIRKFTDKEKEAKTRTYANGNAMPSSAFNFDEEEEKK